MGREPRLVEAWAQGDTSECATTPSMGMLGGPAPYWHSYTHDAAGNRTSETLRTPGAAAVSRSYTYPAAGDPQPHALQQVTTTGASGAMSFTYDQAGNTTSRTVDGQLQELTWNAEGRVTQVEDGGDSIRMVYDADGGAYRSTRRGWPHP